MFYILAMKKILLSDCNCTHYSFLCLESRGGGGSAIMDLLLRHMGALKTYLSEITT